MFSTLYQQKITDKGLLISDKENNRFSIIKPNGILGNSLPVYNWSSIPIHYLDEKIFSDCPIVEVRFENNHYTALCWDWEPGPGPGDFTLDFQTQDELTEFVIHYFFEDNEYFAARKSYVIQNRKSMSFS